MKFPESVDADVNFAGGQYGSFENGVIGDPNIGISNNMHLQHRQM